MTQTTTTTGRLTTLALACCERRMDEWVTQRDRTNAAAKPMWHQHCVDLVSRYCERLIRLGDRCERYGYGDEE